MGTLINGKSIAEGILRETSEKVGILKEQNITPKLGVILVGKDKPSQTYVRKKEEAAKKVGMDFVLKQLCEESATQDVIKKIIELQNDNSLSGLIVQLPLPKHIDTNTVLNAINPKKDVDCLTYVNLGKLVMQTHIIVPPTPGAVMSVLNKIGAELKGKDVVIVGTGKLVGKPLAIMLMNEQATVTACNVFTKDIKEKCLKADIIVSAVGKKNLIRKDMIKEGAIVIDTGVDFVKGVMSGDVNVSDALSKASHVTPTPGGIGPITVSRLLYNTAICAFPKN